MKSAKESIELKQTETETIVMNDTENIAILEENSMEYNGDYEIETENKYEIETENNYNYEIEQNKFENQNIISIFGENNENIIENGNDNDGDVTPPISDDFIVSPSPCIGATNESSDGNAKPINGSNGKRVCKNTLRLSEIIDLKLTQNRFVIRARIQILHWKAAFWWT